jgi:malonyl-CoA/methylmalonyl-CoA synthetase
MLGIWQAGGIAVPLGLQYPIVELKYFLKDTDPEFVVGDADSLGSLERAGRFRYLQTDQLFGKAAERFPDVGPDRSAMILYTSGSTNKPKGVVVTHKNISAQIQSLVEAWEWSSEDYALNVLPLHHVHGIINILCCALWAGATCEILPRFKTDAVFDSFVAGRVTTFMAVPTIYVKLIAAWKEWPSAKQQQFSQGCSRMRLMVSGSAALPVRTAQKWKEISGYELLERYGMTEIGMALSNPFRGTRKQGSVGQPLPGVDVRLVSEDGDLVTQDEVPGEIWVRGDTVFKEYWRQPEITRQAFCNGWFRTGDVATVESGYFRILGRKSVDIIKTGGYKISALETEEVLRGHPSIKECAVIGTEDQEWGERVSAVVTLRAKHSLSLEQLREWASDQLVNYKLPSRLVVVDRLPRNAMGKVKKPDLARLFKD